MPPHLAQACERSYQGNPYLRVPVLLDNYVRSREVVVLPRGPVRERRQHDHFFPARRPLGGGVDQARRTVGSE